MTARVQRFLMRRKAVEETLGLANAVAYEHVQVGLLPKPIRARPEQEVGNQASWWLSDEIEAIQAARIAGLGDEQIKLLVTQLVAARAKALEELPGPAGEIVRAAVAQATAQLPARARAVRVR